MHCKRHIGRRRKKRMRHAFVCVACGMLHKGLHANPLSRITLGLWFGGRLPADLRLGGFGLACRSLELRPHGLPGLRLLICMEYVSMSIQQSPDRAAHKGRHAYESIELHQYGALVRRPSPRGAEGLGLACRSLELRPHGLPGLRLLICMEYVSMSIQQSPDRAAHKGRHACESIELHQFGALVRRPSPRGAEGLETWAWRAGAWLGDLGAAYRTRPGFGEHGVCAA